MLFYIQSDPNVMDLELYQFRSVLQPYVHEWAMISLEDVRTKRDTKKMLVQLEPLILLLLI